MTENGAQFGALARLSGQDVLRAFSGVRRGTIYDLEVTRFPSMPRASAHPPLQVLTYRSPRGERADRTPDWMDAPNPHNMGFVTEMVIGTMHTGTHIDALSHFTRGPGDAWFGGGCAERDLSDFGPMTHDITSMPPIITRGVCLDVVRALGLEILPRSYGITADDCAKAAREASIEIHPHDAIFIRTGLMTRWPNAERMAEVAGAGLTLGAAEWLVERGVVLMGADTPGFEQNPSADPDLPRVVHPYLLIDHGIPIMELVYLEDLVRDRIREFALVVSPLKIRGGTASMVRPLAIV